MQNFSKNKAAFTLIEVVVSFAILAIVGTVLVQSQLQSSKIIIHTKETNKVNTLLQAKLQELELNPPGEDVTTNAGEFDNSVGLESAKWRLDATTNSIFLVPMRQISFKITWLDNNQPRTASDFIIVEPKKSLIDELINTYKN